MKQLRRVKLSSSPHCTFLVVIHSWQKPIHAPTACVPADVWCRLLPPSWSLCCLQPPPTQLPPDSVHTITLARAGYDVSVSGRFVIYISRLWYMDGKIRWQGWATRNLSQIRHPRTMPPLRPHVNTNGGLQWMLMSASHALFLCVLIPIWFSERTTPAVSPSDIRKAVVRAASDEYDCPLCLPWCLEQKKNRIVCKAVRGVEGQLVNPSCFFSPEFISRGNKLQSGQTQLSAHMTARATTGIPGLSLKVHLWSLKQVPLSKQLSWVMGSPSISTGGVHLNKMRRPFPH